MSVINKVLRDLDQRQSPSNKPAGDPLRRYTVGVEATVPPRRKAPPRSRRGVWLMLALLVIAAGGVAVWLRMEQPTGMSSDAPLTLQLKDDDVLNLPAIEPTPAPAAITTALPSADSVAVPAIVPTAPAENTATVAPAVSSQPPVVAATPVAAPAVAAVEPKAPPVVAAQPPQPQAAPPATAPNATAAAKSLPAASPSPKPVAPAAVAAADLGAKAPAATPPVAQAPIQRQQQAARDALAQAQTLWNTGSQDTAVSTLQAAVAVAERQDSAGMLLPLVRELARMELAQGNPAAVLELLVRLEPQLKNQPDLWAVRANAAQRLGRHQDSVLAYGVALQSRPAESRWLLGMAVSLAAMGQTTQAGTMVEKARASGPISPDVALYLRQQGVPMPDGK
jgi:MSHA biogenesis protein MshN